MKLAFLRKLFTKDYRYFEIRELVEENSRKAMLAMLMKF